ncbi:MAG: fibronectin type III domain-containing protein [Pyrinomonadaceae bacterium]
MIALALVLLSGGLSCGKRKPPVPPSGRVMQRAEATGFQRGNQVILSWKMPARNAANNNVQNITRVDIYRLAEPLSSPLTLSEEEYAARSVLIATVPVTDADFALKTLSYTDTLELAGQPSRLRYAVRFVNASGQKASFSNFALIEPAAKVASAPTSLSTNVSQDAISLIWEPSAANADGSTPASLLGYNVYRSDSKTEAGKILNKTPVTEARFADRFFEFGKEYFYFVRAISVGSGGLPIESLESNLVAVTPKDTFPPSAPASITLAASPTTISIFFPTNPENDVAGYSIYRSTEPNLKKSEWNLLTPTLLETNTFQDANVVSGTTYYYYLTATDKFGNVSAVSEIVSETIR